MKIQKIIIILAVIIALSVAGYALMMVFNANEKINVHLGIKKQDKTYILSLYSTHTYKTFGYSNSNNTEIPPIIKANAVFEIDGDIYVEPEKLDNIFDLVSKNYTLFSRKRKNSDGFVTINNKNNTAFSENTITEDGEKIGDYINKKTIELKNDKGDIHNIRWTNIPSETDIAEENCIISSMLIADNYKPGATSYYTVKVVLVKLKTILDFLNNGSDYKYDAANEILYIIQQ